MSGTAFLPAFAARTHGAEKGRQGRYCLEEENGAQGPHIIDIVREKMRRPAKENPF
jgi:hypothetical protein